MTQLGHLSAVLNKCSPIQFEPGVVFSPIDANYLLPFRPERSLVRTHMHTESKVVVLQQYIVRAGMFCALE